MRNLIALLLFGFQLGAIVYARFVPTRYFCWAPYDTQTDYVATATVMANRLSAAEFRQRYRRPPAVLTIALRSTFSTCWNRWNRSAPSSASRRRSS